MKAKRTVALFTGLALTFVTLAIIQAGCTGCLTLGDAIISTKGTVYEWVNAPLGASSLVYAGGASNDDARNNYEMLEIVDSGVLGNEMQLVGLEGATVTLDLKNRTRELFGYPVVSYSNDTGKFLVNRTTSPQRQTYRLIVEKPGYLEAVTELEGPGGFYGVVILVR